MTVRSGRLLNEHGEREMNKNQLGLVDTCFEEGQYESGIAVLDQLRSPKYKPSQSHIRQLLYLALYPSPPPISDKGKEEENVDPSSPSKMNLAKQQKSPLLPSPAATEAARRLLTSFANTNTPSALLTALPRCTSRPTETRILGDDDQDSYIAREATRIEDSRHCWGILKEGFIQRKKPIVSTPKGKGRKRQRDIIEEEQTYGDPGDDALPAVVSENAWPILEWLVGLFEQDELDTEASGLPRHSPLLLSQIPPSRSGSGPRWEADLPLDIIIYCLQQQAHQRRKLMGARLITLLINLTSTIHFDINMFTTLVCTRLFSSAFDDIATFFAVLPTHAPIIRFKVALCRKYLGDPSVSMQITPTTILSRPKPQARVIRATHRVLPEHDKEEPATTATVYLESIARKYSLPPSSEIVQLVEKKFDGPKASQSLRVKFELLVAYAILQSGAAATDKDPEWSALIHSGGLKSTVHITFDEDGDSLVFREILNGIMAVW